MSNIRSNYSDCGFCNHLYEAFVRNKRQELGRYDEHITLAQENTVMLRYHRLRLQDSTSDS
jgi:hypothetical protein